MKYIISLILFSYSWSAFSLDYQTQSPGPEVINEISVMNATQAEYDEHRASSRGAFRLRMVGTVDGPMVVTAPEHAMVDGGSACGIPAQQMDALRHPFGPGPNSCDACSAALTANQA